MRGGRTTGRVALDARVERRSLAYAPGFVGAAVLQAQVVVVAAGGDSCAHAASWSKALQCSLLSEPADAVYCAGCHRASDRPAMGGTQ